MDKVKFDALTRAFATGTSRRTAIKGLFGGAVGVAVATTRLNPAGAQSCTPDTVLADCVLPDECTTATCEQFGETWQCVYAGGCDGDYCCGGICQECCGDADCGGCDVCSGGYCEYACSDCQECEGLNGSAVCVDKSGGVCCGGYWVEDGQCCDVSDCILPDATFCSSTACIDYMCTAVPECPEGQTCCGYGQEGAYCAECCNDDGCLGCAECVEGWCTDPECCADADCPDCAYCSEGTCYGKCSQSQECCHDECVDFGECCREIGDYCALLDVAAADGSPQNDCCDGLVCCDNVDAMGPVCAQCCNDWDCPKGAYCHGGWCEWPDYCDNDKECPKDTCCCKDGTCSGKCCHHPHPPKPPKPPKPAPPAPAAPVTTLPATGAGPNDERNSLLGATALGAAAALYAAKKLRETPEA